MDIDALERAARRTFTASERDEIRAEQQRAYRWTFLVSGLEHPEFVRVVAQISEGGPARLAQAAAALSA
jgi:hypothetical protein